MSNEKRHGIDPYSLKLLKQAEEVVDGEIEFSKMNKELTVIEVVKLKDELAKGALENIMKIAMMQGFETKTLENDFYIFNRLRIGHYSKDKAVKKDGKMWIEDDYANYHKAEGEKLDYLEIYTPEIFEKGVEEEVNRNKKVEEVLMSSHNKIQITEENVKAIEDIVMKLDDKQVVKSMLVNKMEKVGSDFEAVQEMNAEDFEAELNTNGNIFITTLGNNAVEMITNVVALIEEEKEAENTVENNEFEFKVG